MFIPIGSTSSILRKLTVHVINRGVLTAWVLSVVGKHAISLTIGKTIRVLQSLQAIMVREFSMTSNSLNEWSLSSLPIDRMASTGLCSPFREREVCRPP